MGRQFRSTFQVKSFKVSEYEIRHILIHRDTKRPTTAASLYEAHLSHKTHSHNTIYKEMLFFGYLYTWAEIAKLELDILLLTGLGLTQAQIRSFSAWLKDPLKVANGSIPQKKRKPVNDVLTTSSMIIVWFIKQFSNPTKDLSRRAIEVQQLIDFQVNAWREATIKVRNEDVAPDLSDEEILSIENYLQPISRAKHVGKQLAVRDYLLWRMALEFGLRKGEILALRLTDCPSLAAPYIRIIRVEQRGKDYKDPRNNPPRPKTLSRELGFLSKNSVIPKFVAEYNSTFRFGTKFVNGFKRKLFLLPHDFLIVSETGAPLSMRAADDIARNIRNATGIKFNWHLARHAFFNRAYSAITSLEDRADKEVKLKDLVYWGGWESPDSLDIYTRRARRV